MLVIVDVDRPAVGPVQQMAAAGLVGPEFPSPPSLGRIRAITAVAGVDLSLRKVFDLPAQRLGLLQRYYEWYQ